MSNIFWVHSVGCVLIILAVIVAIVAVLTYFKSKKEMKQPPRRK